MITNYVVRTSQVLALLCALAHSFVAAAEESDPAAHVATIARITGPVERLTNPSAEPTGSGPHARFEGVHYTVARAARGDKLHAGEVLQASDGGKALLIFPNGDILTVGSASAYRLRAAPRAAATPVLDLFRGALRAVVAPDGPRRGLEVRTRSLAFGVRGTDFVVTAAGEKSAVAVLSGQVEARADDAPPVVVKAGQTASSDSGSPRPLAPADTAMIRTLAPPPRAADAPTTPELDDLERKAAVQSLAELRRADPEAAARLDASGSGEPPQLDAIDRETLATLSTKNELPAPVPVPVPVPVPEPSSPSPPWGLHFGIAIAPGSYSFTSRPTTGPKRSTDGPLGGAHMHAAYDPIDGAIRVAARAGGRTLEKFNRNGRPFDFPQFELEALYRHALASWRLNGGARLVRSELPDAATLDPPGYPDVPKLGVLKVGLLVAGAERAFSETSRARATAAHSVVTSLGPGPGVASATAYELRLAFEHEPFPFPLLLGYGVEMAGKNLRLDGTPSRSAETLEISERSFRLSLAWVL